MVVIMKKLKKYLFFISALLITVIIYLIDKETGKKAVDITLFSFKEMLLIIPPIFVLLGILDVFIPKETLIKYLGEGSGIRGVIISIFLGSAAAGPLYGAFPVALVLMKKGARFTNVILFLGAWSTTKIPMILFEISALGLKFALTRLAISMCGIFLIAFITNHILTAEEKKAIYKNAQNIG